MADFPEDLRYSNDHEWARAGNSGIVRVGITSYAAEQLGDIVFAQLPEPGEEVAVGDAVGELESTKSVSDLFTPVAGVVTAVNETLAAAPETVNNDPYGDGWLFEVEVADTSALEELLDADAYAESVAS
ncbi:glycine cleavage system protein GcvH [Naumannella cuiyingiana]|uniref:Glycine cleavage system H protein n=1 Tax=Naumannella cuiyingiana TaxID=1347891 RepID=A0A7Z0DC32_9ACTN|nr:glycine cleavage system protein GcvH [Naumannella cuiyingiana]NYI72642.1 glycine cleavage system H protein [Naumannella cuiyingiana]